MVMERAQLPLFTHAFSGVESVVLHVDQHNPALPQPSDCAVAQPGLCTRHQPSGLSMRPVRLHAAAVVQPFWPTQLPPQSHVCLHTHGVASTAVGSENDVAGVGGAGGIADVV